MQREIRTQAAALGQSDLRAVTVGLLLQSINEAIDLQAKQMAAFENHVPDIVLVLLFSAAILTMALLGYGSGLGNSRGFFTTAMLSVFVAGMIYVIPALDRPADGTIRISQSAMVNLRDSIISNKP